MSLAENEIALFSDIVHKTTGSALSMWLDVLLATHRPLIGGAYLLSLEDFYTLKLNALGYESTAIIIILFYSLLAFVYQFSLPIIVFLNGISVYLCRVY